MTILIYILVIISIIIILAIKSSLTMKNNSDAEFIAWRLRLGGLAGIMIGDEYDFVLSRMVHIKLITPEEAAKFQILYEDNKQYNVFFAKPKINWIESITFEINPKNDTLKYININLVDKEKDYATAMDIIISKLTSFYGKPITEGNEVASVKIWVEKDYNTAYIIGTTNKKKYERILICSSNIKES